MASISNRALIVLGFAILCVGLVMPAETTEKHYQGGEVWTETNEVESKTPTIVLGIGFILAGVIAKQRTTDEYTDRPPDD